jgi:hypothetical protein
LLRFHAECQRPLTALLAKLTVLSNHESLVSMIV